MLGRREGGGDGGGDKVKGGWGDRGREGEGVRWGVSDRGGGQGPLPRSSEDETVLPERVALGPLPLPTLRLIFGILLQDGPRKALVLLVRSYHPFGNRFFCRQFAPFIRQKTPSGPECSMS